MSHLLRLCIIFGIALLSACAGNRLDIEEAATVTKASDAMVTQARATLAYATAQRNLAGSTLVASDPSCIPGSSVEILIRDPRLGPAAANAPLCMGDLVRAPRGYRTLMIDLRPLPQESLRPTLLLIAAVADYSGALAKIVARPDVDLTAELNAMADKANEARSVANSLLGLNLPDAKKALANDQVAAAVAILDFVNDLAREAQQARDIAHLVQERGGEIEAMIPELQAQLNTWLEVFAQGDLQETVVNYQRAYEAQRQRLDFNERLAFVRLINDALTEAQAVTARKAALEELLNTFREAQADLRRALSGNYSDKQRRRIAQIYRDRIIRGLRVAAGALTAFGVGL